MWTVIVEGSSGFVVEGEQSTVILGQSSPAECGPTTTILSELKNDRRPRVMAKATLLLMLRPQKEADVTKKLTCNITGPHSACRLLRFYSGPIIL
jgi:hypothetical protein